jgi:hypothetical protein
MKKQLLLTLLVASIAIAPIQAGLMDEIKEFFTPTPPPLPKTDYTPLVIGGIAAVAAVGGILYHMLNNTTSFAPVRIKVDNRQYSDITTESALKIILDKAQEEAKGKESTITIWHQTQTTEKEKSYSEVGKVILTIKIDAKTLGKLMAALSPSSGKSQNEPVVSQITLNNDIDGMTVRRLTGPEAKQAYQRVEESKARAYQHLQDIDKRNAQIVRNLDMSLPYNNAPQILGPDLDFLFQG